MLDGGLDDLLCLSILSNDFLLHRLAEVFLFVGLVGVAFVARGVLGNVVFFGLAELNALGLGSLAHVFLLETLLDSPVRVSDHSLEDLLGLSIFRDDFF